MMRDECGVQIADQEILRFIVATADLSECFFKTKVWYAFNAESETEIGSTYI